MEIYKLNQNSYAVREDMHRGRKVLIVPVVMMVEGVHNGSHGALFHSGEELGRIPGSWNGIPVVINHPEENGQGVSANSPEFEERETIGRIYNTKFENGKLKSEAWIYVDDLKDISSPTLEKIQRNEPIEVSVGVFTEDEETSGTWNGEDYIAIARNHRPDHLALLPDSVGACSIIDGCGVRTNEKGGNDVSDLKKTIKEFILKGYSFNNLEEGYREVIQKIQSKLDAMDDDIKVHYLQEVYKDNFIYEVRRENGQINLFKRGYSVNESEIEFTGEPVQVEKKVTYVTMDKNKQLTIFNMSDEKKCSPCVEKKAGELINHKLTNFEESDREWLLTQDEATLDKMFPKEQKKEEIQVNKEQAVNVLKESIKTAEDFFNVLPEDIRESMRSGYQLYQDQRVKMIKEITENTESTWSEDDLKVMNQETLIKVHKTVRKGLVDYSANGGGQVEITVNDEVLLPCGTELK